MAKGRILLAHGNADCQKIYGSVLAYEGYYVDVVSEVDTAVALLAAQAYDVVVTDLYLPSDGDECLVRRLRDTLGSHLPVLILTGWTTESHRRLAYDVGADRFLALPIRPRELTSIIAEILDGPQPLGRSPDFLGDKHDRSIAKGA